MKKAFFFVIMFSVFVSSCDFKKKKELSTTSGKINTISVIIDDKLWDGQVGDSIRNKFASPVLGLPQEEPIFTINQFPTKLFDGFMNNCRNIIVIKKENQNAFSIKENEFAKPQNVYYITGKTTASILEILEVNSAMIVNKIKQTEIRENQRVIDTLLFNTSKIKTRFAIDLKVPNTFKSVYKTSRFVWLKKEITSGNTSLLLYQIPFTAFNQKDDATSSITKIRDSIGSLYVHGRVKNSRMITENAYAPYLSYTVIDKRYAYETKGTWEMENDFMAGPFINYFILDNPNKRIIVAEGFCYAPSKEKRDLMFELEAIIKTIKFIKPKKPKSSKNLYKK
jgi:Domain of unknown function (DUF4837)